MLSAIKYPNKPDRPDININVGIMDNLSVKTEDINDDGCPDYPHGKTIKDIFTSNLGFNPNLKITEFDTGYDLMEKRIPRGNTVKELTKFNDDKDVTHAILSAYNTFPNHTEFEEDPRFRDILLEELEQMPDYAHKIKLLKNIVKNDKKLFVAAGNKGSEKLNGYSLVEGIISVGALDKNLKKMDFSADNPFINVFAKGEYDVMPILEHDTHGTVIGYDITEDGVMDVPISEITGYEVIKRFVGKNIEEVKATSEDYKILEQIIEQNNGSIVTEKDLSGDAKALNSKLFKAGKIFGVPSELYMDLLTILNSFNDNNAGKTPILFFKAEKGKVIYNPHIEGEPVKTLTGTCCAVPTALAKVLNAEHGYFSQPATP